jgi:hypothetical protein
MLWNHSGYSALSVICNSRVSSLAMAMSAFSGFIFTLNVDLLAVRWLFGFIKIVYMSNINKR